MQPLPGAEAEERRLAAVVPGKLAGVVGGRRRLKESKPPLGGREGDALTRVEGAFLSDQSVSAERRTGPQRRQNAGTGRRVCRCRLRGAAAPPPAARWRAARRVKGGDINKGCRDGEAPEELCLQSVARGHWNEGHHKHVGTDSSRGHTNHHATRGGEVAPFLRSQVSCSCPSGGTRILSPCCA